MSKINRKTPVPKSLFNKDAGCRPATFLKRYSGTSVHLLVLPKYFQNSFFVDDPRMGAMKLGDHITCTKSRASHPRCLYKMRS